MSFKKKGFPDFRDRNLISIFQHNHEVIRVDTRQDYNRLKRELDASGIVRRLVLSGMGGFGGWMISVVMSRGYGKIKSISKKLEI